LFPAGAGSDLFDNWFDPIESQVRARARDFIEELIRGELDDALARPRYQRSTSAAGGVCGSSIVAPGAMRQFQFRK